VTEVKKIPISNIVITGDNPRQNFPEESLKSLGESMLSHGQIDPIIVRPKDDYYELVVGERRWRAAQLVGMSEIEAKIQDLDDSACHELRLIENTHREDLTGVEKGDAVFTLMEKYPEKYPTIKSVADSVKKSYSTVILWCKESRKLSPKIKSLIIDYQRLTSNHIQYLIKYNHDVQEKLAKIIIDNKDELTKEQWRKFFKLYDENPTADLNDLIREAKGVEFAKIDISKLTPEAKKEVEDILKERKEEMEKKRKESLAKAHKERAKRKPSKPKKKAPPKPKPPETKPTVPPVPFRTIEKEAKDVMIPVIYPLTTYDKVTKFMGKKRMIVGEAIVYLTEKGLEVEGIE